MLVAEVQTPSDTTYRVFDFDRVDPATGEKRQLHVEQGMACIDFGREAGDEFSPAGKEGEIVRAPQFTIQRWRREAGWSVAYRVDSPWVLVFLTGSGRIIHEAAGPTQHYSAGDTWLIPPGTVESDVFTLQAIEPTEYLSVHFPKQAGV